MTFEFKERTNFLTALCVAMLAVQLILTTPVNGQRKTRDSKTLSPLISVDELFGKLESGKIVILDLGPEKEIYDKGHIYGARYVDWVDDMTDLEQSERYNVASREKIQKLMRRVGVDKDSRIVLYDDLDSRVSIRMYWTLKYYGLTNLQILDGGRKAWESKGNPFTDEIPAVTETKIELAKANKKMSIEMDTIADRLQDPKVSLIDGRPVKQYSGEVPGKVFHTGALHEKKGHIPGAVNIFWKDNFNEDGTFKSKEELEKLYEDVTGSEMIVTYCNEGLHATPPWFVLSELLGQGNVRVYDSSLSEWANSDQPMEKSK